MGGRLFSQTYFAHFATSWSISRSICMPTKTEKPCMKIATPDASHLLGKVGRRDRLP
jgi:hypothetical protein